MANDIDLILLAGGAGARMGGDKLRLRGRDGGLLVRQWFDALVWPAVPRLILPPGGVAPAELTAWPTAHDAVAGEGPLRGVATALAATTAAWLVVVAIDTPGIGRVQIDWLCAQRDTDSAGRLWMMRRGDRVEPFPLLIHRDMTAAVTARVADGRRAVHGLADEPAGRVADAPTAWPAAVWRNLNHPADLAAYLAEREGANRSTSAV